MWKLFVCGVVLFYSACSYVADASPLVKCTDPYDGRCLLINEFRLFNDNILKAFRYFPEDRGNSVLSTGNNRLFPLENIGSQYANNYVVRRRCINLGDDGCISGSLPGSGKDDEFLGGSGTPGKRSMQF